MTDHSTPNATAGTPGAGQPTSPLPIPDVFAERHVAIAPVRDATVGQQALHQARSGESPNALDAGSPPPVVDLRAGDQRQQAAHLPGTSGRRP